MDEKLDPQQIMARLRELLTVYEQSLGHDDWHLLMKVTWRPRDGSGGGITFVVGTEPVNDDDD